MIIFLIVSCNVVLIDLAHGLTISWSLVVIGIWAAALLAHWAIVLAKTSAARKRALQPGESTGGPHGPLGSDQAA